MTFITIFHLCVKKGRSMGPKVGSQSLSQKDACDSHHGSQSSTQAWADLETNLSSN